MTCENSIIIPIITITVVIIAIISKLIPITIIIFISNCK